MAKKTVKEHLNDADRLSQHVDDANALVRKLKDELEFCRKRLEWMKKFCHPMFKAQDAHKFDRKGDVVTMETAINLDIRDINDLLGDRATT